MPKTDKKIVRTIYVGLRKTESIIADRIDEQGDSIQEIIRGLLRDWAVENLQEEPAYVQLKREELALKKKKLETENMDPIEYARKFLGFKIHDGLAWRITPSLPQPMDLDSAKKLEPSDPIVKQHKALLETINKGTPYHYSNGRIMDQMVINNVKKYWDDIADSD